MIYLPAKTRQFYEKKATEAGADLGTFLFQKLVTDALAEGMECDHPRSAWKKHGKPVKGQPNVMRCSACGVIFKLSPKGERL